MEDHRARALRHFKKQDGALHKAAKAHYAHLPSRLAEKRGSKALFAALSSSVVAQQLGGAAADTIWNRVRVVCGGAVTPEAIQKASPARLRGAGLSGAKMKTLKALAKAVLDGTLDLPALRKMPEEEAVQKLTAVWGIGPWTAEMFLLFALGRTDVFSPGDLGLLRAMQQLYGLPEDVPRAALIAHAEKWSPYRSYACLILWRMRDAKPL